MLNNYDQMQNVQNSISALSEEKEKEDESETVEALSENVITSTEEEEPKEDTTSPEEIVTEDVPQESPENEQQAENVQNEQQEEKTETTITPPETYVVQKGDTLETISKQKYGDVTHIDAICELNGLDDGNLIFIGQKLLLP